GKALAGCMRQVHAGGHQLLLAGTVEKDALLVKVDGGRIDRRLRWSDEVVGLRGLGRLFAARKSKPGDRFTLLRYEPVYNAVVTVRVAVKGRGEVGLPAGPRPRLRGELWPAESGPGGAGARPLASVGWLDDQLVAKRRQTELPGLGPLLLPRTRKNEARAVATAPARAIDLGARSLIPLDRAIPRP